MVYASIVALACSFSLSHKISSVRSCMLTHESVILMSVMLRDYYDLVERSKKLCGS